ncbi:hypothetical protein SAY86_010058 [Trapa natans]|uniref:DUF4408 domain-containing protein n=1 Tax=Trapa natans TaxID=22666 RepID=A0AAN7KRY9_TRANT|nr:hypothetical protein SAY86_010058 [Trapa natans]
MEPFRLDGILGVDRAKKAADKKIFHLRKIANLLRAVELVVVLFLISRFFVSVQLPEGVKSPGEYFKDLKLVLLSPRFVFVIGNLIVIALFAKSGQFSRHGSSSERNEFYSKFVEKSERLNHQAVQPLAEPCFQGKKAIFQKAKVNIVRAPARGACAVGSHRKTQSEKLSHWRLNEEKQVPEHELRRSETDINCMRMLGCSETLPTEGPFPEDSMSKEEFRQTVEAFIARQQRFLRNEED